MFNPEGDAEMDEQRRLSLNGARALNPGFVQPTQSAPMQPAQPPSQNPVASSAQAGLAMNGSETGMFLQMLNLMQQQMQQQQQQLSQQQQMMAHMMQQTPHTTAQPQQQAQQAQQYAQQPAAPRNPELIMDALAGSINEFRFEAESGVTFPAWYARYEDLFVQDASRLEDSAKVRLLIRKLGTAEHARYCNFILPRVPRDLTFDDTVSKLKALFGSAESLLSKRYKCLQIVKAHNEDLMTFACRVNRACVDFQFSAMTEEQFKCLMLVCGLREEGDAEIRTRLLARIEDKADLTLEQLSAEAQRITSLKVDSAMIATEGNERVFAMRGDYKQRYAQQTQRSFSKQQHPQQADRSAPAAKPPGPCWLCGDHHWIRDCSYRSHKCEDCGKYGHREGHCNTAGRKKRKNNFYKRSSVATRVVSVNIFSVQQNRKYVTVHIGQKSARLQLDTGSDITIIGRKTWKQLGMPNLSPAQVHAKTATGAHIQLDGEFEADITINGRTETAIIRVIPSDLQLLGADVIAIFSLAAMPMNQFCNRIASDSAKWEKKFPAVFHGKGLCTKTTQTLPEEHDRGFKSGDCVYAKWYSRNSWKWVPAQVVRMIGNVIYEVKTDDGRMHRRHVNQLRKRDIGSSEQSTNLAARTQLPLDLLIEGPRDVVPVEHPTVISSPLLPSSSDGVRGMTSSPPLPSPRPVPVQRRRRQQPVQSPRRSNRSRRFPRRLDGYLLQ
uniref:Peptidase A2 domain-containing protein n=1 Tax=Anopheles gambiae TaxID=7165 RepID=A0A0E3W295_ANOGA